MTADEKRPTLATARKIAEARTAGARPSDFLTESEQKQLKERARKPRRSRKLFTQSDAIIAEIIARFGYDTYKAWIDREISMDEMLRYIAAERAREAGKNLALEAMMLCVGSSCARPKNKHGGVPKGLQNAQEILKSEQKKAGGER